MIVIVHYFPFLTAGLFRNFLRAPPPCIGKATSSGDTRIFTGSVMETALGGSFLLNFLMVTTDVNLADLPNSDDRMLIFIQTISEIPYFNG